MSYRKSFFSFIGIFMAIMMVVSISPVSIVDAKTDWDKSSLSVSGSCNSDGTITFTVKNDGSGNMTGSVPYEVHSGSKTGPLVDSGTLGPLASGQSASFTFGGTVKLFFRVSQRPGHPGTGEAWADAGACNQPPPPPTDLCPNLEGVQTEVPAGMVKDDQGNCVVPPPPPTDLCPNLEGVQTEVPAGMVKDDQGNCVVPPPPPTDLCPNLEGVQTEVPAGMVKDASGNCVTPKDPSTPVPPPPAPPQNDVCPTHSQLFVGKGILGFGFKGYSIAALTGPNAQEPTRRDAVFEPNTLVDGSIIDWYEGTTLILEVTAKDLGNGKWSCDPTTDTPKVTACPLVTVRSGISFWVSGCNIDPDLEVTADGQTVFRDKHYGAHRILLAIPLSADIKVFVNGALYVEYAPNSTIAIKH